MERWSGKLAVVTGASAGIGAGICIELVKSGMIVVGLARREERIESLKTEIPNELRKNLHALKCDVSKEEEIIQVFKHIDDQFGGVSVLVNNAGVSIRSSLLEREDSKKIKSIMDINVFGLVHCTREAYKSMEKYRINDGHIIHINSVAGHFVLNKLDWEFQEPYNSYSASKFAVTALTETYRQDFIKRNTKIKVTVSINYICGSNGILNFQILVDFTWNSQH